MRISAISCFILCLAATGGAAGGDVYEPHAMMYFQVPFSGSAEDSRASFGLRLDQTWHSRDEAPDFRRLLDRPALAELQMGSEGVRRLSFAGMNYARAYQVNRANGEEAAAGTTAEAESAEAGTAEDAPTAETTAESDTAEQESADDEGSSFGSYLKEIPAGYFIGIGLGIFLLTGLGG
jgi:hypothetical protein